MSEPNDVAEVAQQIDRINLTLFLEPNLPGEIVQLLRDIGCTIDVDRELQL